MFHFPAKKGFGEATRLLVHLSTLFLWTNFEEKRILGCNFVIFLTLNLSLFDCDLKCLFCIVKHLLKKLKKFFWDLLTTLWLFTNFDCLLKLFDILILLFLFKLTYLNGYAIKVSSSSNDYIFTLQTKYLSFTLTVLRL